MPKEKKEEVIDAVVEDNKNKEAIGTLKEQYKDYAQKANHYKEMALKAQGAIEVLTQLEKEPNEG